MSKQTKGEKIENEMPEIEEKIDDKTAQEEETDLQVELNAALLRAENAQKHADELTDICQRLQADFDNYRKRNAEMTKRVKEDAAIEVIIKFLPVLDVVDRALSMIKDENILSGLIMIQKQLISIFEDNGVKEIDALDKEFDPNLHNAVMCVEDSERAGKVVEIMQKGYIRGDKVIRHCAVKIAK